MFYSAGHVFSAGLDVFFEFEVFAPGQECLRLKDQQIEKDADIVSPGGASDSIGKLSREVFGEEDVVIEIGEAVDVSGFFASVFDPVPEGVLGLSKSDRSIVIADGVWREEGFPSSPLESVGEVYVFFVDQHRFVEVFGVSLI